MFILSGDTLFLTCISDLLLVYLSQKERESMDIQNVPKVGISSVVHSKHIDADSIDVIDNDIALFDSESVISFI